MIYHPKTLINPTSKEVEVMVGGQLYIFAPGEIKHMDGFIAHNILLEINNCPLKEYEGEEKVLVNAEETDLEKMAWKQLVSLGAKMKVFNPGMSKGALIKAIKEKTDEQD